MHIFPRLNPRHAFSSNAYAPIDFLDCRPLSLALRAALARFLIAILIRSPPGFVKYLLISAVQYM
jgi:hypothetical protein